MKIKKKKTYKTYKSKKVKTLSMGPQSTLDILYFDHSIKKLYKQVKINFASKLQLELSQIIFKFVLKNPRRGITPVFEVNGADINRQVFFYCLSPSCVLDTPAWS